MILFQNGDLSVRRLEQEDAPLLVRWLSDPAVLEYYEGRDCPHDLERVQTNFYESEEEGLYRGIVQFMGQDIGYIQFYPVGREELTEYGYADYTGKVYGMDQFIGEPQLWSQGIGSLLVGGMVKHLLEAEQADLIVMDPQCWNHRALRVYEKIGFVRSKLLPEHELHEGEWRDCWLLTYTPAH
ncbi:N-acetyltransferase GCN5 [Paenibacillus sp. FSL R7-277]|uniref:GNAT family N-acetyltransferase n=1 Tax=Paenibacillus sp. FSL R7-277 TaxID=1227352 RepID=UPI0003E24F9A|nr:GNAT family N-acetyltransferase [Paenibacillus sp. FSL R7-277]ETT63501.1 N-acetyltransferase GCN5 [Paenibacillus sp. FSL R7-277]